MQKNQELFFNVLKFDWPTEALKFHFFGDELPGAERIYHSVVPDEIKEQFPNLGTAEQEHLYTTYTVASEGSVHISLNLSKSKYSFAKRYFNWVIRNHFLSKEDTLVRSTFISDTNVWIPATKQPYTDFTVYEKYTIKVQIKHFSGYPEILLSFDGRSKVFKQPANELIHSVSAAAFNWVMYDGAIQKWDDLQEADEDIDNAEVFPVLNADIEGAMGYPYEPIKPTNKYSEYLDLIVKFYKQYINVEDFKRVIDLHKSGFIKVKPTSIDSTSEESNELLFGNGNTEKVPYTGIKLHKPYKKSPHSAVNLFYIFHEDDYETVKDLDSRFKNGFGFFKGLERFAKIMFHTQEGFSIRFKNRENPIEQIEEIMTNRTFDPAVQYIAVYITPFGKFDTDKQHREIYYQVKELLLKRNITSQAIDPAKMEEQGEDWVYSLPNISIAMLAKLNGIPWQLKQTEQSELIVGIGAFLHKEENIQYIGSSFSFTNHGRFNRFEYFMKNEIDVLAGSIADSVRQYAAAHGEPSRLIIHFYKTMSKAEIEPIQNELKNLGLDIPVFIITINKTESRDILAFDKKWNGRMPMSGTFINLGGKQYLLFNSTRYATSLPKPKDGYPFPVKLKIDCTDKEELKDTKVIKNLIEQVYQFSRMYWKSVRQQNLPVTIKYPEMVAEMLPHFDGNEIPEFGKDNLWFL